MKKIAIILATLGVAMCAWAVPARRGAVSVTQSDGSTITISPHGDELFHWITDEKGNWIERDSLGMFRPVEPLNDKQIATRRAKSPRRIVQQTNTAYPHNIAPRGLYILVNFNNLAFKTSQADIDSMVNGENYSRSYSYKYGGIRNLVTAKGSARKYFQEVSDGQYNPQFDVVGPVTVSHNYTYYGSNNDAKTGELVKEACKLAQSELGVDFSQYDNDGDGYVDFVYIRYAGYGEADSGLDSTIWPHKYELENYRIYLTLNGKRVNNYACSNELSYYSNIADGIGTFCHEFGHVLGLPDIYCTNNNLTHKTSGEWDVMDYGCYNNDGNTPPTYTAYERFYMGWATPRQLSSAEYVTLDTLSTSNEVLMICPSGTSNLDGEDPYPSTFYLLENRQKAGLDKYIPGHGMLITKVNYSYSTWVSNVVNNTANNLCIDIIEADDSAPTSEETGYLGKVGDAFPKGATQYLDISGNEITNIVEQKGKVSFSFKGAPIPITGVEQATTDTTANKRIRNGQIIITRGGEEYDLLGRKIQAL